MPEGPEVRKFTDQLSESIAGRTLTDIAILSGRYIRKYPEGYQDFTALLPQQISKVDCKGKFIYLTMNNSEHSIWSTLGMTGAWSKTASKHTRLMFVFEDGTQIFYNDKRNFGTIKFVKTKAELDKKLGTLGPDMLQEKLLHKDFQAILNKHGSKTLPEFLMNQKIISGVGNYLKAEILYFAKLSPKRKCNSLLSEEAERLNDIIRLTIQDSYISGGSTMQTYVDMYGKTGDFNSRLAYGAVKDEVCGGFAVYKRKTDPLGNQVISEDTKDKRTTWWVPSVQK